MKSKTQGEESAILNNLTRISVDRRKLARRLPSIVWPERFKSKTALDLGTGCWNWTGATNSHPKFPEFAYGRYAVDGRDPRTTVYAHRFAYEFVNGPTLGGLGIDIDHICRNTRCVNPLHLRALTHRDNLMAGKRRTRVPGSVRWLKEQAAGGAK